MSTKQARIGEATFLQSLAIQIRVIKALMMREMITRFGRENVGVLWLFGEPMLFTLVVSTVWRVAGMHHGSALPIEAFAITGYSSVLMWRNTASRCNAALSQNRNLMYHRNVRVIDVFFTRILLEMAGATTSFALLTLGFLGMETFAPPVDMLKVVGGWLMLAWFGAGLGLTLGTATAYSELVDRFWHPTSYVMFPFSGAAFMVEWLPESARQYILLLPMVHGVEYMREGFFGNVVRTHHDLVYMATVNLVLTFTGLMLMRGATRRMELL
ncbi:MAG: ABC transporter permease [Burkholderiaceae bacterium]